MKYECGVVQDLLPLYHDDVCSRASREVVEEHLQECAACRKIAENLTDHKVDEMLVQEKNNIIKRHEKMERKKTYMIGIVTACVLLVPTLICLICNLAIGHALDWFFIVLASMLLVASLLVVPFITQQNRGVRTIVSFTGALLLLLLVCCIYTKGDWFWVVAVPTVFGLSVFLAPHLVCHIRLPKAFQNHKGFLVMLWDTIWLYAVIVVCGIYVKGGSVYWGLGLTVSTYCLFPVWIIFWIVRYVRRNVLVKTGWIIICVGVCFAFCNDVISLFSHVPSGMTIFAADLRQGFATHNLCVLNANIYLVVLLVSVLAGGSLILLGELKSKDLSRNKS